MSNIGLNTNIYHSTRIYLDLLNNFLVDFNYAKETGNNYKNEEVIKFFNRVSDSSYIDPETQILRSFFNRFYQTKKKSAESEIKKLIGKVEKENLDNNAIQEIEELIEILKYECSQSYARMKGIR